MHGPVEDGDLSACCQCGGDEGGSVREIRFDLDIKTTGETRFDDPVLRLRFGDVDARVGQHFEGHVDVRTAGNALPAIDEFDAQWHHRCREQKT